MADETATQVAQRRWNNDMRIDRRQRTADALTNLLTRAIEPFLGEGPGDREGAARAIFDVVMQHGLFVLTEQDRQDMGLPPRDDKGWSVDEIRAYEARFLAAMLNPIPPFIVTTKNPASA